MEQYQNMSFMKEYIEKQMTPYDIEKELTTLIKKYTKITGKHLIIYSADLQKGDLPIELNMDDFYTIRDLLRNDTSNKLSFYIETPGGHGEAAEEIGNFLRNNYEYVDFLIAGECKSAGTILVMCGDEIHLNETGSLGPIDAQINVGRNVGSAHDYIQWVQEKMNESEQIGILNNFDALMVAQITPDELKGVQHSLDYGKDLVIDFLHKYKFKNWKVTETRKITVDNEHKLQRAREIADILSDHSVWKSHGRSLKRKTLEDLGLKINSIDDNHPVSEIIERVHVLIRMLFSSSPSYKFIATKDTKIVKNAVQIETPEEKYQDQSHLTVKVQCNNCSEETDVYINFTQDNEIDMQLQEEGLIPFPENSELICKCGEILHLQELKKQIENQYGKFI